ncbi:ECF-type riboflavin transporter substrate-binding protein [Aerococcaceae bacterium NML191292]|nr:ECF-type riboflavin transporter substrate-binding protein [Aerococcaceae bacterium NML210727]MCW6653856.1 ECF-type riboflavin transporter substrate-binding protein [Aerococcaceae bacterium NML201296]MCW6659447.1 ECF-type riboflavin transporter substrate-binding protein [Aerococcaceae bacterium NML191292]MCW6661940.1 ECF-type riboflavin transporter substrate-binding protein [Aerococcaceae bacterium NML201209]MCW6664008.1 ECF-type riboflavin transporter substrate-binding protein [Aerococcaceae
MNNKMTTQTIVAVAIGSALFAVLMVYGGIPVFTNTKLTTAYIVPVIVGGLFGVIPAALVGLFGNILADFIGGWGYWFDWSIGNGLAALFIGLLPLYGARIREGIFTVRHAIIFAVVSIFGIAVSFGLVTPLLTQLLYQAEATITFAQAQVAVISNASVVVVVGIPLLFVLANRYRKQTNLTEEF